MTTRTAIKLPAQTLERKAFAPYGEIISPRTSSAETGVEEPKLILTNGTPRLWIMKLKKRRLVFADMARCSQCLGSMQGKEWFVGVAPIAFAGGDSAHGERNQRPHRKTAHLHQSGHLGRCSAGLSVLAAAFSRCGD